MTFQALTHTRGPWHWDSDKVKGDNLGRIRYRVTALGKTVAQLYYSSEDVNAEADARLIAAAPEVLTALQAFVAAAKSWHDFHHGSDTIQCDWLCECLPAAQAAIAKAAP